MICYYMSLGFRQQSNHLRQLRPVIGDGRSVTRRLQMVATEGEGVAEDCRIVVQIVLTYNSRLLTKF